MSTVHRLDATGVPLLVARLVVGTTLVVFSIHKIVDPVGFMKLVNQYGLVPAEWPAALNLIAVVVPWLEMIGGSALILGVGLRGVGATMFLMLIGFTAAIVLRTIHIMQTKGTPFFEIAFSCGCAGNTPEIIWIKLLTNAGLIVLALLITLSNSRRLCLSSWLSPQSASSSDTPVEAIEAMQG